VELDEAEQDWVVARVLSEQCPPPCWNEQAS